MLFITRILFYGPFLGFLFSVKLLYTIATTEESRQFSLKCMQCIHNVTSLLYTCCNLPLALLSFSHKLLTLLWKRDGGGGTVVRGIQRSSTAGQKMKCFSPVVSYFFFNAMKPTTFHSISRNKCMLLLFYKEQQWRQSSSDLSKIAKGIWLSARTSSVF